MIGRVLGGRYKILEAVDSGGMAYVYKALCKKTNLHVAVKVLKEKFCCSTEYVTRFKREAQAAFSLEHENIVRVRDIGCDEGIYYMVMDFIEGSSLKALIEQQGAIAEKDAVLYAIQICSALSAAHKRGIIHRDIKPHNILIDQDNNVRLTDFGIAKSISAHQEVETQVIGSVYYVSPEQACGDVVDARTDIYSLGIVLYEMLTGELPYTGEQTVSVALKHINEQITEPIKKNHELSQSINNIVLKATSKNRKERYRTADLLKQDLARALVNKSGSFVDMPRTAAPRPTPSPQTHRRHKILKICILSLLIVILIVGAAAGISLFWNSPDQTLSVPDMTGQDMEAASARLAKMGFGVEISYAPSETLLEGLVITQTPEPGSTAKKGDKVTLTVSTGPAELIMPDLSGLPLEEAQSIIEAMGLELADVVYELREDVAENAVVSQIPAADSDVAEGTSVSLIVSGDAVLAGARIPKLSGLHVSQAVRLLNELGFVACFVYEEESDLPEGSVIEQSPGQGIHAYYNNQIDLWVSAYDDKPFAAHFYTQIDITDKDSRIKIVRETEIDGVIVGFVQFETQATEVGKLTIARDITSLSSGSQTIRVYVNNAEAHASEVHFVRAE